MSHLKPSFLKGSCLTPGVREAIRKRNRLRKRVEKNREEWLEACRNGQSKIMKSREDSWRELESATNEDEGSRDMRQGLLQGSVLSPVFFLFYINELASKLLNYNLNALFADDVSVLATRPSLEEAEAATQQSVDMVVRWAKEAKLRLNVGKSEAEGKAISHVSTLRLL